MNAKILLVRRGRKEILHSSYAPGSKIGSVVCRSTGYIGRVAQWDEEREGCDNHKPSYYDCQTLGRSILTERNLPGRGFKKASLGDEACCDYHALRVVSLGSGNYIPMPM